MPASLLSNFLSNTSPISHLKIIQVTDQLSVGGAENVLVMLANLLHSNGHSSAVLTTVAPGALAGNLYRGVTHINLARTGKWNPRYMKRMIKILKEYDVVHVHSAYNMRYVYVAARLFGLRKRIFYHEHFGRYNATTNASLLQKLLFKNVVFIAVSQAVASWALTKLKLPQNKVYILPNTIIKEEAKTTETRPHIHKLLLISNFRYEKNIGFAIEVLRLLNKEATLFHLTIIGQKIQQDYYTEIINLVHHYNLTGAVEIITSCNAVQQLLPQYDMALHTSNFETGPLVLIEYAAHGLPFITYNTGEVVQEIKKHLPELIADNFDAEQWAHKIQALCTGSARQALQQKLITIYSTRFSPEAYYNTCIHIYQKELLQ